MPPKKDLTTNFPSTQGWPQIPFLWRDVLSFTMSESLAAANVAADGRRDREVVVLRAVLPDTVVVSVLDTLLEKFRHVFLRRRVALVILTNALSLFGSVITFLARFEKVSSTANGLTSSFTRDREGVAVDKGHVAVCSSGARKETFQLSIAALGVGLGAYEHGTAGPIIWRHTDLATGRAERAGLRAPDACVGVMPVRVVRSKADAFQRRGSFSFFNVGHVHSWVDRGRPIVRASEIAFITLAGRG